MKILVLAFAVSAAVASALAANAAQYVYPAKGQDAATQSHDEADCSAWAIQQTGYDPAKAPAMAAPSAPPATAVSALIPGASAGGVPGAASALGSVPGVAGMIPGGGTAAMAVQAAGALNQLNHPAQPAVQTQAQASPGQANFEKARAACLTGRGYTVN
jgi:hypothetical protein